MLRNIANVDSIDKKAFVLPEVLIASIVAVFVFGSAWAIYHMAWRWWYETAPFIESQRIARMALSSIIDGQIDSTVGTDDSYGRRNGIAWAVYEPEISSNISAADKIEFGLEKEKEDFGDGGEEGEEEEGEEGTPGNVRAFYLGQDPITNFKVVYYRDNNSVVNPIKSTLGITDLRFEKFKDINDRIYIKVTATIEKDILGTRTTPYHIKIGYSDYVYLRNFR